MVRPGDSSRGGRDSKRDYHWWEGPGPIASRWDEPLPTWAQELERLVKATLRLHANYTLEIRTNVMNLLYQCCSAQMTAVELRSDAYERMTDVAFMTTGMEGITTRALAVHGYICDTRYAEYTIRGIQYYFVLDITERQHSLGWGKGRHQTYQHRQSGDRE